MKQVERMTIKFNERTKLKDFTFLGIATNAKGLGIQTFDTNTLVKVQKQMDINKGEFYMFYPIKKQMVISFGEGGQSRLGQDNTLNSQSQLSMSTKDLMPSLIKASYWHSVIIDKDKNLYRCGQVRCCGPEWNSYQKMSLNPKIKLMTVGKTNITVLGEDNKVYVYG